MTEELLCFVLMPFAEPYRDAYDHGILPAVQKLAAKQMMPWRCFRADDIARPGSITRDLVEAIFQARIIVADLTDNNPNVFYELGIADTIGNKTVMLTRDTKALPFDLRSYRVIPYDNSPLGLQKLQQNLLTALEEVVTGGDKPTNLVQDYAPIRHQELISTLADVLDIERHTKEEVWIIGPNVDIDIQVYAEVMRENIVRREIKYKYILPETSGVQRSWQQLEKRLALPPSHTFLLQRRCVEAHQIESEIVLYDPYTLQAKVYLMPPVEEKYHFYFRIQGSRAIAIRERFQNLWGDD